MAAAGEVVLSSLRDAASQNPAAMKCAEERLRSWETEPGFYSELFQVFSNYEIDANIRWQAVVYFKNGVDRYWRPTAPNAIPEKEKANLRQGLLKTVHEPIKQIAVQLAVTIAKAARYDVPNTWQELLPTLSEAIQSNEHVMQHRGLLYLHHTLKSLASKRLIADRRAFQTLSNNIIGYLLQLWYSLHQSFLSQVQGNDKEFVITLEKAILALKILRKVIVQGLKQPSASAEVMSFVCKLFEEARILLQVRKNLQSCNRENIEKYIVLHEKIWYDLLDVHPFSFVDHIQTALTFICSLCFTDEGKDLLFQRFAIFCFNILKNILLCPSYHMGKNTEESASPENMKYTQKAYETKSAFFRLESISEICRALITNYLPLTQDDLALWDDDPEGFAFEEGGDSWRYSWRPCCETIFITLFHEFRESLAPILVQMVSGSQFPVDPCNMGAILQKDAIYNAVGLAAFDLYDEIDFDAWLTSSLALELGVKDSNYRIVRRRVCLLLGQWSGVKLSPNLRPKVYELLMPLLAENEDMVVRLAAAKSMKIVIDDFEFSVEELEPYLSEVFTLLFSLLKEVNECDTKLNVLNVLSYFIERSGVSIRPIISSLVHYLPKLWDESASHDMLRCSILTTLIYIIQGLGSISKDLLPFLVPVLSLATDLEQGQYIYLLEDGLELWLCLLHNTTEPHEIVLSLLPRIPPLLKLGSENLRNTILILQAYILLCPEKVISTIGPPVVSEIVSMYSDLQDQGLLMILRLTESLLMTGLPSATQLLQPMLNLVMLTVHDGKDFPVLMSLHLSILSRVILSSHSMFAQLCITAGSHLGSNHNDVAGRVLDVWCDKMPCVTANDRRKLLALALCSLITAESPVVLSRIYSIFLNLAEALNDITRPDEESGTIDTLMAGIGDAVLDTDDIDYETEHDSRRRQMSLQDPVHTVVLKDYAQSQIRMLSQQLGENYKEIVRNIDLETRESLQEYIEL